jgi:hypothetical protein
VAEGKNTLVSPKGNNKCQTELDIVKSVRARSPSEMANCNNRIEGSVETPKENNNAKPKLMLDLVKKKKKKK